jgi:hypothetical protein
VSARNHATRKTSRDRSSGRVLARIECIFRRVCPNLHKSHLLYVGKRPDGSHRTLTSNSNFQAFLASKPECDAHICLNLGFTSQNFPFTQVSRHVCYFWSSPFRMDDGITPPGDHGICHKGSSVQVKPPRRTRNHLICQLLQLVGREAGESRSAS